MSLDKSKLKVGQTYYIEHERRGNFLATVLQIQDEHGWLKVRVEEGVAIMATTYDKFPGDELFVHQDLATFHKPGTIEPDYHDESIARRAPDAPVQTKPAPQPEMKSVNKPKSSRSNKSSKKLENDTLTMTTTTTKSTNINDLFG
jgi:hypothetical protein